MPHINRIRVNNVKYNFGTQYYDDFIMRFSGKNAIYDLANGGGKSVLMLLLLQNLLFILLRHKFHIFFVPIHGDFGPVHSLLEAMFLDVGFMNTKHISQ